MMDRRSLGRAALGLAVVGGLGLGSRAARAETPDTIKARGTLRAAIDLTAPPYGMLDAETKPTGSDVEAATLLARDLGVKLEIVPVNGPNRVPFLLTNKADLVLASFSITEERRKVIDYSAPYGVVPVMVGAPKGTALSSVTDLVGKTVAVTRGTTSDQELTRAARANAGISVVRYDDDATTNAAVASGQQDYLVAAPSVIREVNRANPSRNVEQKFVLAAYPYAIGLRKDQPELKAWLDDWVGKNLKNGRLNEVYTRYFGTPLPAEMLR
ncbi:transporter substrate-binding domain-containing protein [Roseomonas elaeocarpi]|uniref:Transporter substrate-binding domain-containing protein n=1 Tax=Roseomonas elaeocarpi TaxID=907779 RepID=A0ABV6JV25_9PROT